MKGNSATKAKNKYNAANYDRINLSIKKEDGGVAKIDKAAEMSGLSRNAYILEAIREKMERESRK